MKIINWIIVGTLCLIGAAHAATYKGYDFPYVILNDAGITRYCIDPGKGAPVVNCWSDGMQYKCTPLESRLNENGVYVGFIKDCKKYEVTN